MQEGFIWIAAAIAFAGICIAVAIDGLRKALQAEAGRLHARFCEFAFQSDYGGSPTVTSVSQLDRLVRRIEFHLQWVRNTTRVEDQQ